MPWYAEHRTETLACGIGLLWAAHTEVSRQLLPLCVGQPLAATLVAVSVAFALAMHAVLPVARGRAKTVDPSLRSWAVDQAAVLSRGIPDHATSR